VSDYEQAVKDFDELKSQILGDEPVEDEPPANLSNFTDINM
jgi:hypothetical protein